LSLARKHKIPLAEVKVRWEEFKSFDANHDQKLCVEEFKAAIRNCCGIRAGEALPIHLFRENWFGADTDESGGISFEEYLRWCQSHAFQEEMIVDPEDRFKRALARTHGFMIEDVEKAARAFEKFDLNSDGQLDVDEFRQALTDVSGGENVAQQRLIMYWTEADSDHDGCITLEEFVVWCLGRGVMKASSMKATP